LPCSKVTLSFPSLGVISRYKNWQVVNKLTESTIHITGFDHYLLLFTKKKKIILTIHDIEVLKRKSGIKRFIFKKLWFDIPIKNATMVTTISKFSKQELLKLGNYKTPIQVISNPNIFKIEYDHVRVQNRVTPKILLIGTKANKNLHRVLKALRNVQCELNIVGALSEDHYRVLTSDKTLYLNHVNISKNELKDLYKTVDLLCFTSTYEGFGLPIIEAQSLGCPVVTSNCSSMPEVAGHGAYLVDPFSEDSIRKGVESMLENSTLRSKFVSRGFENAAKFEPELIAKMYLDVYRKVHNG
jgi:glycosyltransferase involved in cell wall biosynthesis